MDTLTLLKRAVQVIVFVFGAFGYFLREAAPPAEISTTFSTGLGSFVALCLLLLISAMAGKGKVHHRLRWVGAAGALLALAIFSAFFLESNRDRLVFGYPPSKSSGTYVGGYVYTPEAQALADKQHLSKAQVVAKFGGLENREMVWPAASLHRARMVLLANYVLMIIAFSATLFCLTEGVLVKQK